LRGETKIRNVTKSLLRRVATR